MPARRLAAAWRRAVDALSAAGESGRDPASSGRFNLAAVSVVFVAGACLAMIQFYGLRDGWPRLKWLVAPFTDDAGALLRGWFLGHPRASLAQLGFWSACTVLFYFVVPALHGRLVLGLRLKDLGLGLAGLRSHWRTYALLYAATLPLVVAAALNPSFQATYPFYDRAGASVLDFLAWQVLYAAQFAALEFFFRGWLIHGTKRWLGVHAVLLPLVPYCMIHFTKPFPEAMGALFAGLVLGGLSLVTGSVWGGVAVHLAVAITMDLLAVYLKST